MVSVLSRSQFRSSDSFASKVLLVTWLPIGMSLASFGALSSYNFWFFPAVVPFPTCSGSIRPSSGSSLVSFHGCRLRSLLCFCLYGCFVSALRFLYSVRDSLFLRWTLFVCAITSSVSGCFRVLLLRSVTRSDLRFSLSDGVARWDESLVSLCPLSSTPVISSGFVGCSLVFIFVSVSGVFSLPFNISAWFPSALYWWVSFAPSFMRFSFRSPCWIVGGFCLACSLPFFHVPPWGLWGFFPSFRGSSFGYISPRPCVSPHLIPSGFILSVLVAALFLCALLLLPCVSSPYCLFRPWAFPSLSGS